MNIPEHSSWSIKDSSKLETFQRCPRLYFYEYILGWSLDVPAHDAYFGESFHKAREHQLTYGYEDIQGAYNAFVGHYRQEFGPETDDLYKPKNPIGALLAIQKFAEERKIDLYENEVVILDDMKMLEISGTVPVDEKRSLHYRMDSIMQRKEDGRIFSWDHKTTKKLSRFWREKFHLSIQNGTYTHCMYCMFPIEQVLGVEFDGTCLEYLSRNSKTRSAGYHVTFEQVPAFKTPEQMNTWLWNVNDLLDNIEREMDRLYHSSEDDTVMMAFPMNTTSCTDFFGCPYHDFCLAWQNPLQQCYDVPLGFRTEYWDPSKMETTVKKDLKWR